MNLTKTRVENFAIRDIVKVRLIDTADRAEFAQSAKWEACKEL